MGKFLSHSNHVYYAKQSISAISVLWILSLYFAHLFSILLSLAVSPGSIVLECIALFCLLLLPLRFEDLQDFIKLVSNAHIGVFLRRFILIRLIGLGLQPLLKA